MSDRIKEKLERFIRGLLSPVDFFAPYACKVTGQNSDGTLELRPEDQRLSDFSKVPMHLGIPDTTVTIQSDARVMLEFENGDRNAPYVSSFDYSTLTKLEIGPAGGTTNFAALANLVNDGFSKVHDAMNAGFGKVRDTNTSLNTHTHAFLGSGTVQAPNNLTTSDPVDCGAVGDVSASIVKVR